jgi:hypothetical protein
MQSEEKRGQATQMIPVAKRTIVKKTGPNITDAELASRFMAFDVQTNLGINHDI